MTISIDKQYRTDVGLECPACGSGLGSVLPNEDIVEWLRNPCLATKESHEAADEIERLRELNEEWREAILDLEGYIFSADWMFVSDKTKAAYTKAVEG